MALYSPSTYDSFHPKYTKVQCSNGGKARVQGAKRDRWGRLLPKQGELPTPECHGRAGGLARAATAKRINGKFARKD